VTAGRIRWPARFDPALAPVHVRNELAIAAPAARAWTWLLRAEQWPAWYPNSSNVRVEGATAPNLGAGVRFRWRTFGVSLVTTVEEFVPGERIAWRAVSPGVDAYHAWLIEPRGDDGCWVLTEETQYGALARLGALVFPRRMFEGHALWLERLARQAAQGMP
jgi:uncharacterized protein YndB with AHSA1/START domain